MNQSHLWTLEWNEIRNANFPKYRCKNPFFHPQCDFSSQILLLLLPPPLLQHSVASTPSIFVLFSSLLSTQALHDNDPFKVLSFFSLIILLSRYVILPGPVSKLPSSSKKKPKQTRKNPQTTTFFLNLNCRIVNYSHREFPACDAVYRKVFKCECDLPMF